MPLKLIYGTQFMGAASFLFVALLLFFMNRGKIQSQIYNRSRHLIILGSLVLATHFALQFVFQFREMGNTIAWAVNLPFYVIVIPAFNLGELNLLRAGHSMQKATLDAALFVLLSLVITAIGIATDTYSNEAQPWRSTTFLLALLLTIFIVKITLRLHRELRKTNERLADEELATRHESLRYTAQSIRWVMLASFVTPWAGAVSNFVFQSIYGIGIFYLLLWFLFSFLFYGVNMAEVRDVDDEIMESTLVEEEKKNDCPDKNTDVNADEKYASVAAIVDRWIADEHYLTSNLTIDMALSQMGISAGCLNYYLHEVLKIGGYRQWLAELRIEHAERLFRLQPEYSIEAVGTLCGFADKSNFTRAFKARFGMPPSKYVKLLHSERKG